MNAPALLDTFAPRFHVRSAHQIPVQASHSDTFQALLTTNFSDSTVVRTLMRWRGYGSEIDRKSGSDSLLENLKQSSFQQLAFIPGQEIVFGILGRFWRPDGGLVTLATPREFIDFEQSGFAKAAWSISVEAVSMKECLLRTETRVVCFGSAAQWKFRAYWFLVGLFSGLIRSAMLKQVKRQAEAMERNAKQASAP